jgi:hypothetical protein
MMNGYERVAVLSLIMSLQGSNHVATGWPKKCEGVEGMATVYIGFFLFCRICLGSLKITFSCTCCHNTNVRLFHVHLQVRERPPFGKTFETENSLHRKSL